MVYQCGRNDLSLSLIWTFNTNMVATLMRILLLILALALPAGAIDNPWVYPRTATNVPVFLSASANSNANSSVHIRPNRPTGIYISGVGTNNATNNLVIGVQGSIDNVSSNRFPLFSITIPVTGTNWFRFWTNVSLQNLPFLHYATYTNGSTGVTNLTITTLIER